MDFANRSRFSFVWKVISTRLPVVLFLAIFAGFLSHAGAAPLTAADYSSQKILGWTVWVEQSLATHPRRTEALKLIKTDLAKIKAALPPAAVSKLKTVPIWLSRDTARGAAYHPSAQWLEENGRVVEMERSIELANIDDFIDWSTIQPEMLLHEMSHAWHHQFVPGGYDNATITRTFASAEASGKYESVRYHDGSKVRAYALNDRMEFFAECSEAYFGRNDFQPFNQRQLKKFDRPAYKMVAKMWGVPK